MVMKVEYSSNNSGGSWWLNDDDWKALETAGWKVLWADKGGKDKAYLDTDGRYMGALATDAEIDGVSSMQEAVESWEKATGQTSTEAGCPCCGPPHRFTLYDDKGKYVSSGPDVSYEASW